MNSLSTQQLTRRSFLQALGVGLIVSTTAFAETKKTSEPGGDVGVKPTPGSERVEKAVEGLNPNVFLHVSPTGEVTIVCHRSEMGQGIRSSLPVLIADELGADMARVKILQADGDKAYGDQNTDGSNSVRGIYEDMRRVAATARMMLVSAAAARLKVPPESLEASGHFVVHKGTKQKIGFGDLALEAGKLPVPKTEDVKLRPDAQLLHIGKKLPLLDAKAYVTGTAQYGADIRLPNMLVAVVARPPVVGAKFKTYNKEAALAVAGVKHVIEMPNPKPPYMFQPFGGVAVVAENTWAAIKGRDALEVNWDLGANANYSSDTYREALFASVRKPGQVLRNVGDVDAAMKAATKTVQAEYYVPHLPHVTMEPPAALAHFTKDGGEKVEVWASTQNPQAARTEVARALGLSEANVTVHTTFLGGGFGRKSKADFCSEAALLSKAAGVPVRVQWTRADDIHNDYLYAVCAQQLTAALDEKGNVTAWQHRTAFPPIASTFNPAAKIAGPGDLQQGVLDLALSAPNVRAEACEAAAHVRVGWLRSVYNIFHAFAINSFIDEIAFANKEDPKVTMLKVFGPPRILSLKDLGIEKLQNYGQPIEKHPVDAARLHGVVEAVTKAAKWKNRKSLKGRALGLAAHRSFNSYAAVVASVTKAKDNSIRVDEMWIAIDGGLLINPERVVAQMEGAVINGMSYILYGGVTHKNGAVEQSNFDSLPIVRMDAAPRKIHVELVKTKNPPGGIGEPGLPPVAPAVANAVFALTGKRIREFGLANAQI